jgi:hypothetical protein
MIRHSKTELWAMVRKSNKAGIHSRKPVLVSGVCSDELFNYSTYSGTRANGCGLAVAGFVHRTQMAGTDLDPAALPIGINNGFGLDVWVPGALCAPLGVAHIIPG